MRYRRGTDVAIEKLELRFHGPEEKPRQVTIAGPPFFPGIAEDAGKGLEVVRSGVDRNRAVLELVETAKVVQPEDMVSVGVRDQYRIDVSDVVGQTLQAELGRRVDKDTPTVTADE